MTIPAGIYWIAALPSAGTARTRGNAFTRDIGVGIIASNNLIRSGGLFEYTDRLIQFPFGTRLRRFQTWKPELANLIHRRFTVPPYY